MSNLDFLDEIEEAIPKAEPKSGKSSGKSKSRRKTFDLPIGTTSGRVLAAKAMGTESTVAGQYIRRTFTFRPDQLDEVNKLAQEFGISGNDLARWAIDLMLDAVAQGEAPPVEEVVVTKRYTGR